MARKGDDKPKREPVAITRVFNIYVKHQREEDFRALFGEFYPKVIAYVERRRQLPDPIVGGDDIALSVFRGLYNRVCSGKLSEINTRWKLWSNLTQWADQKVTDQQRRATSRGKDPSKRDADFELDEAPSRELDPADAAALRIDHMLSQLIDPETPVVAVIAVLRLLGCLDEEIRRELQMDAPEYDEHIRTILEALKGDGAE